MNRFTSIFRAGVVLSGLLACGAASAVSQYHLTLLQGGSPIRFFPQVAAVDINEAGTVIGYAGSGERGLQAAYVWPAGTVHAQPVGQASGHFYGMPTAINNQGHVVGVLKDPAKAFVWHGSQLDEMGPLPGDASLSLSDINDRGEIVGQSGSQAVIWRDGVGERLPVPTGTGLSSAVAINEQGTAVGVAWESGSGGFRHALAWKDGAYTVLEVPDGYVTASVGGLNDSGLIVGHGSRPSPVNTKALQAAVWRDGQVELLPDLVATGSSHADAVNNMGQIVGGTIDFASSRFIATLWEDGQAYSLEQLLVNGQGWKLENAAAINDAGQIVGGAFGPNGAWSAYLLTPVPEAGTVWMMGLGLGALGLLGRRRARRPSGM